MREDAKFLASDVWRLQASPKLISTFPQKTIV
jgi:hypothetical protein